MMVESSDGVVVVVVVMVERSDGGDCGSVRGDWWSKVVIVMESGMSEGGDGKLRWWCK